MKQIARILLTVAALLLPLASHAQSGDDVFKPITKYMSQGDVESLSSWFDDNLELSIFSKSNITSRTQAKRVLERFFESYAPRSLDISHTASRSNMKTALGTLNAGGEKFLVTIFIRQENGSYQIQQLKIERNL